MQFGPTLCTLQGVPRHLAGPIVRNKPKPVVQQGFQQEHLLCGIQVLQLRDITTCNLGLNVVPICLRPVW